MMESIDYLNHIQVNGNNLQFPFILNFRDDCGFHCHNLIHQELFSKTKRGDKSHNSILNSNERYSIHSHNKGLVSMELSEVQELVNNNPIDILGYKPLIPVNKLSNTIKSISASSNHGCSSSSSSSSINICENDKFNIECKKLLIQIAPLSLHDLEIFKSYIEQLSVDMNSLFFSEEIDIMSVDKMNYISIYLSDCKTTEELTTLLAARHEVLWIEERPNFHTNNRWATNICQGGGSSYSATTPMYYANILGDDEIIAVADTGLDMNNCYFYDTIETSYGQVDTSAGRPFTFDAPYNYNHRKVIGYISYANDHDDDDGHGTHVCGSVAGLSYLNYGDYKKYDGLAVHSKLVFFDIGNEQGQLIVPSNLEDVFAPMYAGGARIFSNSWGSTTANEYNGFAQSADKFMRTYPDSLILFAAGNDGTNTPVNSIFSPSNAKNIATVGASLNDADSWQAYGKGGFENYNVDSLAQFSSRGPTFDGRLKPDFTAPGFWINSAEFKPNNTEFHCTTKGLSGTSMATPIAAGAAALARQYFTNGYYPSGKNNTDDKFIPSGSLLKALLIHSSQELTGIMCIDNEGTDVCYSTISSYPSNDQGYGRLQLDKILNFGESSLHPISFYVIGDIDPLSSHYRTLATGQSNDHTFTTPSIITNDLKITLCYTDIEAALTTDTSQSTLINNLDIVLIDNSNNQIYRTLTFSTDGGTINNVEMILVSAANLSPSRSYTVRVSAVGAISSGSQPYALIISNDIQTFPEQKQSDVTDYYKSFFYLSEVAKKGIFLFGGTAFLLTILFLSINYFNKKEKEEKYKGTKGTSAHQAINSSEDAFDLREIELAIRESAGLEQAQRQAQNSSIRITSAIND